MTRKQVKRNRNCRKKDTPARAVGEEEIPDEPEEPEKDTMFVAIGKPETSDTEEQGE